MVTSIERQPQLQHGPRWEVSDLPFAQALWNIARDKGIQSQSALAKALGHNSNAAVGKWLLGRHLPLRKGLDQLIERLDLQEEEAGNLTEAYTAQAIACSQIDNSPSQEKVLFTDVNDTKKTRRYGPEWEAAAVPFAQALWKIAQDRDIRSQATLGKVFGQRSSTTVGGWLKGKYLPSKYKLGQLIERLGLREKDAEDLVAAYILQTLLSAKSEKPALPVAGVIFPNDREHSASIMTKEALLLRLQEIFRDNEHMLTNLTEEQVSYLLSVIDFRDRIAKGESNRRIGLSIKDKKRVGEMSDLMSKHREIIFKACPLPDPRLVVENPVHGDMGRLDESTE